MTAEETADRLLLSTSVKEYAYVYTGGSLMQLVVKTTVDSGTPTTQTLNFRYDANGTPMSVSYNGTEYFYVLNLQGDITAIVNSGGTAVVRYTYDAWGNILTTSGSMANTLGEANPLRYRGYVYDQETGLYYVSSRYYDPEIGRWINADSTISGTGGELLGYNQFVYCFNNPVNMDDATGNWPKWLETAAVVVSAVVAVTAVVVMATTVASVAAGAIAGVAAGKALLGATIFLGAALSGINGGVANAAKGNSYINGYIGGATGGAIQAACSKTPVGTVLGGGVGVAVGTTTTDVMNNWDPDSADSTAGEIASNAITSGGKALVTSSLTAFIGEAAGGYNYEKGMFEGAMTDGCGGLMPQFTIGFGEAIKAFFGAVDDALVYIWG